MAQSIAQHQGRNLRTIPVAVGSGTTEIIAAPDEEYERIKVCSYALVASAAGTIKFSDGTDQSGAMKCSDTGGISFAGQASSPGIICDAGAALSLVTTAAFNGHLSYVVEP